MKYKTSKYNYFIDYKSRKLLFNGISGAAFHMSIEESQKLITLMENIDQFAQNYPNDFDRLKKMGYIIENDFDEIAYLKFKNRQATLMNKAYQLTINPTLECNFRCWYCYEKHPKGHITQSTTKQIKRHIKYMVEKERITELMLDWFGGEPLLYFYEVMYPIAMYAKKLCAKFKVPYNSQMTTNAYCVNEKMIPYLSEMGTQHLQITVDGDRNRHNKIRNINGEPTYDKIMHSINLLCSNLSNVHITLRINYDNQTFKTDAIFAILDDIAVLNRKKISVNLQRVWQTEQTEDNKIEQQKRLTAFIEKCKEKGFCIAYYRGGIALNQFYSCYVSKYWHTEINYDGKVYKCTANDYSDKYVLGKLLPNGVIEWNQKIISQMYANPNFENPHCLACCYLPICNGPCPKVYMEIKNNVDINVNNCPLQIMEISFEKSIIDHYEFTHLKKTTYD